ncbi:carbohydrate ABC transporter permease [Litorilinea aerophila]|uniref:Carbohydrate ABC transporter permease n=1 Tax=Litorilinea aerophila TaxID=1204385 RepID=A0A540VKY2_9CHLR|nr:carbohydrate ABC transporter permease [Litorilinea aerophila]MCC9075099.1 carbohydrate ABC transporter permease [Litorilinea aerophila]OUC05457.1 ABC transporter permease [Litorilinea aerophila]
MTVSHAHLRRRRQIATLAKHLVINFFVLIILLPLAWVFLLSIKSIPDAYTGALWPEQFDFTHYAYVLEKIETLPRNLWNSVYVTLATVFITSLCAVLGGYALVHLELPGRRLVLFGLIASLYFPVRVVSLISIFEIQRTLGLINTTSGLILPYVTLNLAISILIMRSIFEQIPRELIDAARIDGCGPWRTLVSVTLPLITNGLVVVLIVNFVTAWGEYLLAATLTNDQIVRTLPVVLASAHGGMGQWAWPRIAAVYVIVIAPGILVFALAQKFFFQGLLEGALKA